MKRLIIISCLAGLSLTCCRGSKDLQTTEKEVTTSIKDSVVVTHQTVIDTVEIPGQTIEAIVSMDQLKEVGSFLMDSGKGLSTKIVYDHSSGTLELETKLDSLAHIYEYLVTNYDRYRNQDTKEVLIRESKADEKTHSSAAYFITLGFIVAALLLIYLIINKLKSKS